MAEKLTGNMPVNATFGGGYQLVFAAVDPTTGADRTDVVVHDGSIQADDQTIQAAAVENALLLGTEG